MRPEHADEALRAVYAELIELRRQLPPTVETSVDERKRTLRVRRGDVELVADFANLTFEIRRRRRDRLLYAREPASTSNATSSSKHQNQSSPGSSERMIGCPVAWWCFVACLLGESSQQPTSPQVMHSRR